LEIRLCAATSYIDRTGRETHAEYHGRVDLSRYRTDLPLYRWGYVGKS
jgi:hypothetical protein